MPTWSLNSVQCHSLIKPFLPRMSSQFIASHRSVSFYLLGYLFHRNQHWHGSRSSFYDDENGNGYNNHRSRLSKQSSWGWAQNLWSWWTKRTRKWFHSNMGGCVGDGVQQEQRGETDTSRCHRLCPARRALGHHGAFWLWQVHSPGRTRR